MVNAPTQTLIFVKRTASEEERYAGILEKNNYSYYSNIPKASIALVKIKDVI